MNYRESAFQPDISATAAIFHSEEVEYYRDALERAGTRDPIVDSREQEDGSVVGFAVQIPNGVWYFKRMLADPSCIIALVKSYLDNTFRKHICAFEYPMTQLFRKEPSKYEC